MGEFIQNEAGFSLVEDGETLARIDVRREGPGLLVIEHTEVSPRLKGRGVGGRLVEAVARQAREEGTKILPLCGFARKVLESRPELADLIS